MKKLLFIVLLSVFTMAGYAQQNNTGNQQNTGEVPENVRNNSGNALAAHYSIMYQRALRYNDYGIAKNALYNLVNLFPQNDSLLYSLSVLYFQLQQYASAALTARDVLGINPGHTGAMEISAVSFENIGAKERALESYEKLYLSTDDFQSLYQMAFLQYDLKRYNESLTNADILLEKKEAEDLTVTFTGENNQEQEYPIRAAIYNLKGLIAQAQGNKEEARKFFNEALSIAPGFPLAKENLQKLDQ